MSEDSLVRNGDEGLMCFFDRIGLPKQVRDKINDSSNQHHNVNKKEENNESLDLKQENDMNDIYDQKGMQIMDIMRKINRTKSETTQLLAAMGIKQSKNTEFVPNLNEENTEKSQEIQEEMILMEELHDEQVAIEQELNKYKHQPFISSKNDSFEIISQDDNNDDFHKIEELDYKLSHIFVFFFGS